MINVTDYLENIYKSQDLPNARKRREVLVNEMAKLESNAKDCASCTGLCCTFIANSMHTDPIQTLEIYRDLVEKGLFNEDLVSSLKETVQNNRLDNELSTGKNSTFRRTYTCTFLTKGPEGCGLSRSVKPYGCLGFNPDQIEAQGEGQCSSNIDLLKQREHQFESLEEQVNGLIKEKLALTWNKLPMPVALLEIHEAVKN